MIPVEKADSSVDPIQRRCLFVHQALVVTDVNRRSNTPNPLRH